MRYIYNLFLFIGLTIAACSTMYGRDCASLVMDDNFIMLADDPLGDNTQGDFDIFTLAYAMSKDSIWFRIETYDERLPDGDMGYALGFDTDNNPNNGRVWGGETSLNKSMKCDLTFYIFRNFIEPTITVLAYNGSDQLVDIKADVQEINGYILQIGMKLSDINSTGEFNMIAGTGSFDIASSGNTYDDVPDNSYVSISPTTSVPDEIAPVLQWLVSPQPVEGDAHITLDLVRAGMVTLDVYDLQGRKIRTLLHERREAGRQILPLGEGSLSPGAYILSLDAGARLAKKLMIVK